MPWTTKIGLVGAVVTIAAFCVPLLRVDESDTAKILAAAMSLMVVFLALTGVVEELRYARKARYAEAMPSMHEALHGLRDAWWALRQNEGRAAASAHIKSALQHFASALSLVTGVHCRVCVKDLFCPDVAAQPNGTDAAAVQSRERALRVRTFMRSEDAPEPAENNDDYVTDNTDFLTLLRSSNLKCFFSNDLYKEPAYTNSHITQEMIQQRKLPYVATIVWPLRKRTELEGEAKEHHGHVLHRQHIRGFLCVDSRTRGVFQERYDADLGAAFADALYLVLMEFTDAGAKEEG